MQSRATKIVLRDTLLIKGPATIRLQDGEVEALGVRLTYEEPLIVRRHKILSLEPLVKPTYILVTFGPNGGVIQKQGKCGTKIWAKAAELLSQTNQKIKKIMILGASDSGKSTLTTYLINLAVAKGFKTGVVDADIGQSDLAPPGCIGGAVICKQLIDLRDIKGSVLEFVGSTSPMGIEDVVVERVKTATRRVEEQAPDLILINTDGYIDGEGVRYKIKLVDALTPDQLIYITSEPRSVLKERLVKHVGEEKVLLLEGAEGIVKSHAERLERRMSQFHRYLKNGKLQRINLNGCKLLLLNKRYAPSSSTSEVGQLELVDKADNTILLSGEKLILPISALEGMFVALGDDEIKGFGYIVGVRGNDSLDVWTPLYTFNTIYLSLIKFNDRLSRDERIPFKYLNTYTSQLTKEYAW